MNDQGPNIYMRLSFTRADRIPLSNQAGNTFFSAVVFLLLPARVKIYLDINIHLSKLYSLRQLLAIYMTLKLL